jgi:hypothetical protein
MTREEKHRLNTQLRCPIRAQFPATAPLTAGRQGLPGVAGGADGDTENPESRSGLKKHELWLHSRFEAAQWRVSFLPFLPSSHSKCHFTLLGAGEIQSQRPALDGLHPSDVASFRVKGRLLYITF